MQNWENGGDFSENLKNGFSRKGHLKIFFCGLSIIWTTYSPSLASGKQFLPIEKNIFSEKNQFDNFFKKYQRKE